MGFVQVCIPDLAQLLTPADNWLNTDLNGWMKGRGESVHGERHVTRGDDDKCDGSPRVENVLLVGGDTEILLQCMAQLHQLPPTPSATLPGA